MNWGDAQARGKQPGGRLPLIGGKESVSIDDGTGKSGMGKNNPLIDGFGKVSSRWPVALPNDIYWTGTVDSPYAWYVYVNGGLVGVGFDDQGEPRRVVCVP